MAVPEIAYLSLSSGGVDPSVAVLLFLGLLAGASWLISVMVHGGFKIAEDGVGRARRESALRERQIVTSVSVERASDALATNLCAHGWRCERRAPEVVTLSRAETTAHVGGSRKGGRSVLRVEAHSDHIESVAGEVLAIVRLVDPDAKIRPVGS